MKRREAETVGEILHRYIDTQCHPEEFDRQKLCYHWADVVGPTINKATLRRYVDGDTLHVYISSAALKSELAFMAAPLVIKLNETVGHDIIKRIQIH